MTNYALGALYGCYRPLGSDGILLQSKRKDLVMLLHRLLESEHSISKDPKFESWIIRAKNIPGLRRALRSRGLDKAKNKRRFPEVDDSYIDHFVRGYIESTVNVSQRGELLTMEFGWVNPFRQGLHTLLKEHASVQREEHKNTFRYAHRDSLRIRDFMYKDMVFIQEVGLYVPEVYDALASDYVPEDKTLVSTKRLLRGMQELRNGSKVGEAARNAGYSSTSHMYHAFAKLPVSPGEYKHRARVARAIALMQEGHSVADAAQELGCSRAMLEKSFKKVHGMTAAQHMKSQKTVTE